MANDVFANGREISCKAAEGKSIAAFPDVCLTPPTPPAGFIPVPYPNTGFATDTSDGSRTVKISGKEVMLKNKSYFKKSTGDEAATRSTPMGVMTHTITGKVYFTSWSMDVKFEGESVVRMGDLTTHNHMSTPGNSPPWPYVDTVAVAPPPPECEELSKTLDATMTEELPKSLTDGATVGVGFRVPPAGAPQIVAGASSISLGKVARGGKYSHYSQGIKRGAPSNVKQCGSDEPYKYKDEARPNEGHAEAKMIEDFFKSGGAGTLILKVSRAPCDQCTRLIDSVNKNQGGGPDCNKVVVCP